MAMKQIFTSTVIPPSEAVGPAYWFIFAGSKLLVHLGDHSAAVPFITGPAEIGLAAVRQQYLGYLTHEGQPIHVYSAEVAEESEAPDGMGFQNLRRLYGQLDEAMFWLAGRAVQIVDWDRTHQFCSRCGGRTENQPHERAKRCPQCGLTTYPRLAPAIIVLVERTDETGSQLLLARSHRHPPGLYSVLAGFVEPGETLEACVEREVWEEVGLQVKHIRYFGSQPWPFPHSLMIAFTAEYAGGEITLADDEIHEAGWFTADNLPLVPPPISIARQLIDWFVSKNGRKV